MIPLRHAAAICVALLAPLPASAQRVEVQCDFTVECFEAEACDDANFTISLGRGAADGQAVLRSPAENVVGRVMGHDATALTWVAQTPSTAQLLSWGADGTARYTLHLTDGPAVISYHGTCEAK